MFLQRFFFLQQRLLRNESFRPRLVSSDGRHSSEDGKMFKITPIEGLLGRSGNRLLMGMLRQVR